MLTVKLSQSDFKDPAKWAEVAKSIELPTGRMEAIVMRIPGLLPVEPGWEVETSIKPPDEWMVGEAIDGRRQWIVHTREPRFIAEIIDDDDELNPPFEYQMSSSQWLCNFLWLDEPPEDLTILCAEAEGVIETYDAILNKGEPEDD